MLARAETRTVIALGAACLVFAACSGKTPVDEASDVGSGGSPEFAFTSGDDFVRRSDGTIVCVDCQDHARARSRLSPRP